MRRTEHTAEVGLSRSSSLNLAVAAVALAAAAACAPAAAQGASSVTETFAPGRILVMPRAGLPDAALAKILKDNGGGKARRIGKSQLQIVDLPPGLERQSVERLSRNPHIEFAELDRIIEPTLVTNDPYLGSQWHVPKIGANSAWDVAKGAGVTIAVLDTGVDSAHPDLSAHVVPGWNIYDNNSNTADVYGHGTKVAGSAAAALNNAVGVAGVAGDAKIMPIRISSTTGSASLSAMAQGITWAADHGARVANISYLCADSASVNSAASYMKSKGGLVTTAAGNYGVDEGIAATAAMIPVSATNSSDSKTSWSSYGNYVAVAAPGEGIYSTTNGGGYASVSGTSFASPVTAGVVALIMSANPKLSSSDVEKILYASAVDLGGAGRDKLYGYGRVNAAAAVEMAMSATSTGDTSAPKVSIVAPLGSSTVSALVPVDVSASDNVGVTKVELRANGVLVATDATAPFAFSWDSTKVANGMVNVTATAYDAAGNAASSAVSVNVANVAPVADTTPPTVAFIGPSATTVSGGNITITSSATDDSGASGITQSLYIDGSLKSTQTGGSLSYNWNTRKLSAGTYTFQVVASDAAGNKASATLQMALEASSSGGGGGKGKR